MFVVVEPVRAPVEGEDLPFFECFCPREELVALSLRDEYPQFKLYLAVLEEAFDALTVQSRKEPAAAARCRREALAWFDSASRASTFTFVSVCELFDFNIEQLRRVARRAARGGRAVVLHASRRQI